MERQKAETVAGKPAPGKPMTQEARSAAPGRKKTTASVLKTATASSAGNVAAFQQYEAAVQFLQQGKFEKALTAFEKLLPVAPAPLPERCRMYIQTCRRQLESRNLIFATPEEQYDYAISQLNSGYFEEAREQLSGILETHPRADYAFYGLALVDAITGHVQDCLSHLGHAIDLNSRAWSRLRGFRSMAWPR